MADAGRAYGQTARFTTRERRREGGAARAEEMTKEERCTAPPEVAGSIRTASEHLPRMLSSLMGHKLTASSLLPRQQSIEFFRDHQIQHERKIPECSSRRDKRQLLLITSPDQEGGDNRANEANTEKREPSSVQTVGRLSQVILEKRVDCKSCFIHLFDPLTFTAKSPSSVHDNCLPTVVTTHPTLDSAHLVVLRPALRPPPTTHHALLAPASHPHVAMAFVRREYEAPSIRDKSMVYSDTKRFVNSNFGDTVRPIVVGDILPDTGDRMTRKFVRAKLGIAISVKEAKESKSMETQEAMDRWLFDRRLLAWEDVGADGWFGNWSGLSDWEIFWQCNSAGFSDRFKYTPGEELSEYWESLFTITQARIFVRKGVRRSLAPGITWRPKPTSKLQSSPQQRHDSQSNTTSSSNVAVKSTAVHTAGRGLFKLSTELRNSIYEMTIRDPIGENRVVYVFPSLPGISCFSPNAYQQCRDPGILRTCKRIREESMPIYYTNQNIVAVMPPLSRLRVIYNPTAHLQPLLPFMRNLDVLHRFNYNDHIKHSEEQQAQPHYGTATVVLQLRGDSFSTAVFVDAATSNERERAQNCCDGSNLDSISRGVEAMETVLTEAMKSRVITKQGDSMYKWMKFSRMAMNRVQDEWDEAIRG
ncbi:hypothetical protein M409DRAFT_54070 [Zasmidium cellare ATCC 36951]|uniref:Uncharacterized protein n=1 Tax=Zasmidium cellare ATCC 36951 TaxID=1080233 RepID=A0A6A6CKA1_ZASCE|nr:uncharacterized protein M409DRAFT_54070 [Zasmidium cellare ATCC 36951]KAF2167471.1 hypothetical protein M409DRAFT_54070 [Zasmidium cellare ATCC 36951]